MNIRHICIILCCLLSAEALFAQVRVEPMVGASMPLSKVSGNPIPFPSVGIGVKYYSDIYPFSYGVEGAMNLAERLEGAEKENGEWEDWSLRNLSLLAVVDWHFLKSRKCRLFLGLGAGLAHRHQTLPSFSKDEVPALGFCCSPRVGLYLSDRFLISLDTFITAKNYNTFGLRIGYSFGKRL